MRRKFFTGIVSALLILSPLLSSSSRGAVSNENDVLNQVISAQVDKKFTGSPITLKLKDADVHEVLRMISEASGFNIVIHSLVQGKLTLSLEEVPWDQALQVVLQTLKLSAERSDSVLRVMPRDLFLSEKQQELEAKKLSSAAAPRVTRVFPISYSDLGQLAALLRNFGDSQNLSPGNSGLPTTILIDQTTQSLIVRDTNENLDRIKKMISLLDVQTPQVLIEAKVVEASEIFAKSIGGSFGIGSTRYGFAFNGPASLIGTPSIGTSIGGAGSGVFRAADVFTIDDRIMSINSAINVAESENKVKVVTSPRNVVLSGKTATISQSKAVGILTQTAGGAGVATTTQIVTVQAETKLNVTPRVTNDGSVLIKIDLSRDILSLANPNAPVSQPRKMATEVIVDSGSTLVIGGVLNTESNHVESGVPLLRDIPLIGWLFGQKSDQTDKSELMFFITPKILNVRKAGMMNSAQSSETLTPESASDIAPGIAPEKTAENL